MLIKRNESTSIHMKNLIYLVTNLFKVKNGYSPEIMKQNFVLKIKLTNKGVDLTRKNIEI